MGFEGLSQLKLFMPKGCSGVGGWAWAWTEMVTVRRAVARRLWREGMVIVGFRHM